MPRVRQFDEQEVLNKAMELFWKKGYHATSMDDLVKFAGINRASLYGIFGGKKELFNKALEHYRSTNNNVLQRFLSQQTQVKAGLRNLFYHLIEESLADKDCKGCFVVNTTTELIPGDEELETRLKNNQEAIQKTFYNFLLQGAETGEVSEDKDLKAIANLLYTFFNGFRVISKISDDAQDLRTSVDTILLLLD
ncbi:TetR family transcriptional regulator [marine bacterium AO1-C]|nr:TetR family transcriptional regulator [marine bacterium AO1-C]